MLKKLYYNKMNSVELFTDLIKELVFLPYTYYPSNTYEAYNAYKAYIEYEYIEYKYESEQIDIPSQKIKRRIKNDPNNAPLLLVSNTIETENYEEYLVDLVNLNPLDLLNIQFIQRGTLYSRILLIYLLKILSMLPYDTDAYIEYQENDLNEYKITKYNHLNKYLYVLHNETINRKILDTNLQTMIDNIKLSIIPTTYVKFIWSKKEISYY